MTAASFNRLVYVETTAWLLSPRDRHVHQRRTTQGETAIAGSWHHLLDELLQAPAGAGWLHDVRVDESGAVGEPIWVTSPPWTGDEITGWAAGPELGRRERPLPIRIAGSWRSTVDEDDEAEPLDNNYLHDLRHLIYLDGERAQHLFAPALPAGVAGADLGYHVLLDFRFIKVLSRLRCHLSVSVWSHPGSDDFYTPPEAAVERPPATWSLATGQNAFQSISRSVIQWIEATEPIQLIRDVTQANSREVPLPTFWVVEPGQVEADPMTHLRDEGMGQTNVFARALLGAGDAREDTITATVVRGELALLRQVSQVRRGFGLASYLILTGGAELAGGHGRTVERTAIDVVADLTDFEAEATHLLAHTHAYLEILRNHFDVYRSVIERGNFLWDALSIHFPVRRGARLARVHRSAELLHQILLQAVADLDHLASQLRGQLLDIEEMAERLSNTYYARMISERPADRDRSLRQSLIDTGLFGSTKDWARDSFEEADRVKTSYHDMVKAIESAFDERRARESDRLQDISAVLAAGLGITSLVTIFDATIDLKPEPGTAEVMIPFAWVTDPPNQAAFFGVTASLALGLAGLAMASNFVRGLVGVGRLGSVRFRREYRGHWLGLREGVLRFLRRSSTDNLDRRKDAPVPDWEELDLHLGQRFAHHWDTADGRGPLIVRTDIRRLGRQIEQWGVRSLLRTERARHMYRYRLPNLTCLYRCVSRIDEPQLSYVSDANMVAGVDFDRTLERLEFTASERRAIDDWLVRPTYPTAQHAWAAVRRLKLRSGMTAEQRAATMAVIGR